MRIAINGAGRIGRLLLRALWLRGSSPVVHVNELNPDLESLAYLLRRDSSYGRFPGKVRTRAGGLEIEGEEGDSSGRRWEIAVSATPEVRDVDWRSSRVDALVEATGVDAHAAACHKLVRAGLPYALVTQDSPHASRSLVFGLSAPPRAPPRGAVVCASTCDGVAIAPVLSRLSARFGVQRGHITTLHPWLSYQNLLDGPVPSLAGRGAWLRDYALGRASPGALIPKSTSAARVVEGLVPELRGRLDAVSFRVPTAAVTYAQLNLLLARPATRDEVLEALGEAAPLIRFEEEPIVSTDLIGEPAACVVDLRFLSSDEQGWCSLMIAYDNEWGYVQRLVDLLALLGEEVGA